MIEILLQLWLPILIIFLALGSGGVAWFIYVRSLDIPWDDRQPNPQKKRSLGNKKPEDFS